MPCYHPVRAVLSCGSDGRRSLSFDSKAVGKGLSLPCGRCTGCRLERARQWAVRIMHESKMHDENSFLTLTYDDDHLPGDGSLSLRHLQGFFKRFRQRLAPKRIRFFACGEYGERLGRPHYHAVVFGWFPSDAVLIKRSGDMSLYSSRLLSSAWGHGFASVGRVTFDSALYVANYAQKKVTGPAAGAHYKGRRPEFLVMSRRPGLGKSYAEKFSDELLQHDSVVVRGVESRPPRYYDSVLESLGYDLSSLKAKREANAEALEEFTTGLGTKVHVSAGRNAHRLAVKERVAEAKRALKRRNLEVT